MYLKILPFGGFLISYPFEANSPETNAMVLRITFKSLK